MKHHIRALDGGAFSYPGKIGANNFAACSIKINGKTITGMYARNIGFRLALYLN
ncbi:MAG: hypothetical protein IKG14_01465 [Clostridia bacterium]|nr:hypothetical protein [Clostridia bacterium]